MIVESVRVSKQARDQLITLKRRTGVEHWNVLCRWAVCASLAEPSKPREQKIVTEGSIEMSWRTFAGENELIFTALIRQRCKHDGIDVTSENIANQFKLHLHRGISYLAGDPSIRDVQGLVRKAIL
jgi:DNA sulfur modification protein DndE